MFIIPKFSKPTLMIGVVTNLAIKLFMISASLIIYLSKKKIITIYILFYTTKKFNFYHRNNYILLNQQRQSFIGIFREEKYSVPI